MNQVLDEFTFMIEWQSITYDGYDNRCEISSDGNVCTWQIVLKREMGLAILLFYSKSGNGKLLIDVLR